MKEKTIIIIPTHTDYMDVCKDFFYLMKHNWKDCPFKIVLSITGKNQKDYNFHEYVTNPIDSTLTFCIYNAMKKYDAQYYICMLGDAFIDAKINNKDFFDLIDYMLNNNLDYCNLIPHNHLNCIKLNDYSRYINMNERYGISFVAFIASKKFIDAEFGKEISDLEFEKKYIEIAEKSKKNDFYSKYIILKTNIFNIYPGIVKGKWNRKVLRRLIRHNKNACFNTRPKLSIKEQIILDISNKFSFLFTNNCRKKIKKIISKVFKYTFTTE